MTLEKAEHDMDCPSCTFANSPMMRACVRCGSRLDFSGVAVEPVRRGRGIVPGRARLLWRRRWSALARLASAAGKVWGEHVAPHADTRALVLTLLPGLGHVWLGRPRFGLGVLALWLVLVTGALVMVDSEPGWWLYLGVVALHANVFAVMLARVIRHLSVWRRALAGVGVYVGLQLGLYLPVWFVLTRFAEPFPVREIMAQDPVRSGDTVLISGPALTPSSYARGDLVLYGAAGGHAIDRVLALPGDQLAQREGVLLLNGQPLAAARQPIGRVRNWPDFAILVPEGEVGILPSTLRHRAVGPDAAAYLAAALSANLCVPEGRIHGLVLARLRPWSRAGFIEEEDE
ncbi:MAG: S26 family signal peptidase [Phycisphaerales bacterium]